MRENGSTMIRSEDERVARCRARRPVADITIGYFADGPWAQEAFLRINADSSMKIRFICARFDKPDQKLRQLAAENDISFLTHPNVNSTEFMQSISSYDCDIFVSMSFNQIFRLPILNTPIMKTVNCHAGALPFYRGRNILNWALINDEDSFGITVHYVDAGIDTGDIILQRHFAITDNDDYASLLDRAHTGCAEVLYDALKMLQGCEIEPIRQESIDPVGFYCVQRKEGDEAINWHWSSRRIYNFIRAICRPGPMARSSINGREVKINRARMVEGAATYTGINGSILGVEEDGFLVKTDDSFIKIIEWEYEGRIRMGDRFDL